MRHITLLFLTFLCTCGLALNLSAQCNIDVTIVDTPCSVEGDPSFFINFRVEGNGDSLWTSPTLNVSGFYNTGTLYSAGPFSGDALEDILFQDDTNGACFVVLDRVEADCTNDCNNFQAEVFRDAVEFCESGEVWTIFPIGGIYPILIEVVSGFGDTMRTTLTANQQALSDFYDEGDYRAILTDATGCVFETDFFAEPHFCSSISGRSWLDENRNGLQDEGETFPVNAVISIIGALGTPFQTFAETDGAGNYRFNDLVEGEYRLVIEGGEGLSLTSERVGDDPTIDSDFRRQNNSTFWFGLVGGESITDLDAGWLPEACDSLSLNVFGDGFACGIPQTIVVDVFTNSYPVTVEILEASTGAVLDNFEIDGEGPFEFENPGVGTISVVVSNADDCTTNTIFGISVEGGLDVTIFQEGSLCFGTEGIILTADAWGSDPINYLYEWSNGATTQSITPGDQAVVYSVTVTDPLNSCSGVATAEVFNQGNDTLSFFESEFIIPCDADSVLVTPDTILAGFEYVWFGPQNEIIEGPTFYATRTAFYNLRATNAVGCSISGNVRVLSNDLDDQFIEIFAFNEDSICGDRTCFDLETSLAGNAGLDYTILWEGPNEEFNEIANGNPFQFICTPYPGLYQLTVTNECDTIVRSLFVEDFVGCSSISGQLWIDQAADCDLDAEDTAVPNYVIMLTEASGAVYYALTDNQGNWGTELPLGTYVIEPTLNVGAPFGTCSPPVSVTLGNSPVVGINVFLPVTEDCPQLTTDVCLPFLRRCFSSNAWVDYENVGAVTAENAELVVTLDDFFTNVTANAAFTQDGNTYTFQLGDLPPFASGQIFFSFIVSCDANLGQSHCVEANIKPDTPCGDTEDWNGALVTVEPLGCDGDSVIFLVTNIGDAQMSIPLSYIIVEDGIMLSPTPFFNGLLESNEVMPIAVPATGGTYHLITNQEPNAPADSMPTAVIEGCQVIGGNTFSTGFSNILPLSNGQRTTSVVCRENVGSYDPNDKNGYPLGFDGGNIAEGTRLDYAIRFQNTGTDTAFTVVIRDTIAASLDLATLKFESASHDYTVTLDTHRVLTFVFENILLPDSSVNLAGSQGVINFSIDHDPSLVAGDVILNDAAIYFDFNDPIITNLSRHVISKDGLPVSNRTEYARQVALTLFPNPTLGELNVRIPATFSRPYDILTVTDLYGRELARTNYAAAADGWNLEHLPVGYYIVVLLDDNGRAIGRAGFVRQ